MSKSIDDGLQGDLTNIHPIWASYKLSPFMKGCWVEQQTNFNVFCKTSFRRHQVII